jgi:hypothetical protein
MYNSTHTGGIAIMLLRDCKIGEVVIDKDDKLIGHIIGFTTQYPYADIWVRSKLEHIIPLVHFAGETQPRGIHQGNINLYKGNL